MTKRTKKLLSLLLASAMVFTMNTTAFAEEVALDSTDEAAVEAVDAGIDAYEPIDGQAHDVDVIGDDDYAQVPDNWGINADPDTWETATKIVSTNNKYYTGVPTYTYYYDFIDNNSGDVLEGESMEADAWNAMTPGERDTYISELEADYGLGAGAVLVQFNTEPVETPAADWTVYNPMSYFFNPVDVHLVDGQVVVPKEDTTHQYAKKSDNESYIYRKIKAGENTWILVRVEADSEYLGDNIHVIRSSVDGKKREEDLLNNRYNGEEPIITFSGLKHVNTTYDKKTGAAIQKKGEHNTFDVDAVLIKRENGKNSLVKGLSVKSVSFKNNTNASFPEDYFDNPANDVKDDGSGTTYTNGYKLTRKAGGDISGVEFVGYKFKPQLTKTENANFKGQPSFQIKFDAKSDAKEYAKDIKKAEKANKGADTTFNFEIAQLNIGEWENDTLEATTRDFTYVATEDNDTNKAAAKSAFEKVYKNYISEFSKALVARKRYPSESAAISNYLKDAITCTGVVGWDYDKKDFTFANLDYDADDKQYYATIEFHAGLPMYADKELDAEQVSENGVDYSGTKLGVRREDVKNLKFKKGKTSENSVTGKLWLETTEQNIFAHNGSYYKNVNSDPDTDKQVGTITNSFAYVKTTSKAGGKADVVLTASSVTDPVFGEIPFAIAQGQNDLTGAMTMRIVEDAHGDQYVQYGHYKDADHFTVESIDE